MLHFHDTLFRMKDEYLARWNAAVAAWRALDRDSSIDDWYRYLRAVNALPPGFAGPAVVCEGGRH